MKTYPLHQTGLNVSRIAYGCMNIARSWQGPITAEDRKYGLTAVQAALESGINFFDHADIYCGGKSESVFSGVWEEGVARREDLFVQSKCGIRFPGQPTPSAPHRYDFSYEHITHSVDLILQRLKTEYLDLLLLHRPDILCEPAEVARAFEQLHFTGKVRHFGVSNHHPGQIALLQRATSLPLVANQLELSLLHAPLFDEQIVVNRTDPLPVRHEGLLDYCRLHSIMIQAWSPLAQGRLAKPADARAKATAVAVDALAKEKGVTQESILLAWLLRHPAGIQPIIGTCNPERIRACAQADKVELSREEWWTLYLATRENRIP
ncbi:MAG: aldo/keto reductase [Verrucomicrobiota bacterium]|nr:aldo/keto reductase [Verrucomicrobiota bacterium]